MKRLLIADDVTTNLRLATEVLKEEYEIATAKSGEQALFLVKSFKPDIVILDIGMPRMDGYAVMDKIKSDPQTENIPVIFLTADTSKEAETKALKSGAMDYIRKPFEPVVLKTRLERALSIADERKNLETVSKTDPLTGLWNRTYIEEKINGAEFKTGYLMMLDLDNFKGLNDCFGHIKGDKALEIFARTLLSFSKDNDIVCRLGGDEFIIFKADETDRNKLKELAMDIITKVEVNINRLVNDEMDKLVSVSVGIAQYPEDGENFSEIYSAADKALYYVKQNGKRGYHFYQNDSQSEMSMTRENSLIDIKELKLLISENNSEKGAYQVGYEGFKRIYHFVTRFAERTGQNAQVVLFTLNLKPGVEDESFLDNTMNIIEDDISGLLRRADVATQYSKNQFVIILMNTNKTNGMIAVQRILDRFERESISDMIDFKFDIQDIVME